MIFIEVSWLLSYFLRFNVIPGGQRELFMFFLSVSMLIIPLYVFAFRRNGLYISGRNDSWLQEAQLIIYGSFAAGVMLVIIFYFFFPDRVSRLTILLFIVLCPILLFFERISLNSLFHAYYLKHSTHTKSLLFVGYGPFLNRFYDKISKNNRRDYNFIGHIDSHNHGLPGVDLIEGDLLSYLEEHQVNTIVISYPASKYKQAQLQLQRASETLSQTVFIPSMGLSYLGTKINNFYNIPLVYVNHVEFSHFDRIKKRLFDLLCSFLGLVLLSPLLLVIAVLVKATSKGPVLFRQDRITIDEKEFSMLKFRSMKDCPESQELKWTVENDPRCTKFGTFIRKTSLDELPQLWNIFKGDMSLIGPRPERREFVEKFNKEIPGYRLRHKVKAGLSGWAQVNGLRGDTPIADRVESDLFYIRNWSIAFDIKIIFFTLIKGFVNKNAY